MPPPNSHDDLYTSHVAISHVESAVLRQVACYQSVHKWLKARRVRITASQCYKRRTYEGGKWQQKVECHFMSRFAGSAATRYVQENKKRQLSQPSYQR